MKDRRKRICILEDNDDIREIIEFILEDVNYEVFSYSTIAGFLKRQHSIVPDVFLLDVMLPDGSGVDVCQALKVASATKNIPVMMMSANYTASEIDRTCDAEDFIPKPFDIDDLVSRIDFQIKA